MNRVAVTYNLISKLQAYASAVAATGLDAVPVEAGDVVAPFDGLVLTGGVDVDPALYGEAPHLATAQPCPERDELEIRLLRTALERDLPVLAICRGLQLMNVALGGTLQQHIEGHRGVDHAVELTGRLAGIMGPGPEVNSRHHQALAKVAAPLQVTGKAGDVVEAVEVRGYRWVVGVQWHPEDMVADRPDQRALFEAFATAVARGSAR